MWAELEQKYAINEALQWADDNFHAAMDEDSYYILYLFKFLYLCTLIFSNLTGIGTCGTGISAQGDGGRHDAVADSA